MKEHLTKPGITRLARKAGVKSVSEDVYEIIFKIINQLIINTSKTALIINNQRDFKTLMFEDFYEAIHTNGDKIAKSFDLGTTTKKVK